MDSQDNECSNGAENLYPAAAVTLNACIDDYKHSLSMYDRLYDKVNIALVFCGVLLVAVLNNFDFTLIMKIIQVRDSMILFSLLANLVCSLISAILIIGAVIQLLLMMRAHSIPVFNSAAIPNNKIFSKSPNVARVWLIMQYTLLVSNIRDIVIKKQKNYNSAVTKIVISIILFAISIVIQKGITL